MKKILRILFIFTIFTIALTALALSIKGDKGNPIAYQNDHSTAVGGPYEASNSTSRYALTQAIVENHALSFTNDQAKFASPDLVYYKKRFYSIFTPGVSFIGVPFYIIGKLIGLPQLVTYLSVSVTALINVFLIALLARKIGVNTFASYVGGFIFLFATDAFVYANTFTQHHLTTLLMLLAILNVFGERTVIKNIIFGCIIGAAVLTDLPNSILFFPIILYFLNRHFLFKKTEAAFSVTLKTSVFAIIIGILPFISLFAWYNYKTTGSYLKTGQTIGRTDYQKVFGKKQINNTVAVKTKDKGSFFPFQTRLQIQGMNILLISNERSWLYYSPVILSGFLGFIILYKKKLYTDKVNLLSAIVGTNILLYSMFGDPWGGWAFGPRYLIPAAAILGSMVGVALQHFYKNMIFIVFFFITVVYSVFVSAVGVVTTAAIPPKQEAINLVKQIPYTYKYNLQFVDKNDIKSLVYNVFLENKITGYTYVFILFGIIIFAIITLYTLHVSYERRKSA